MVSPDPPTHPEGMYNRLSEREVSIRVEYSVILLLVLGK